MFDSGSVVKEIEECERVIAAAQARQLRALARFAELHPGVGGRTVDEFAADEIAPLLRISRNTAMARLDLTVEVSTRLPGTLAALDAGSIDLYKARIIAEVTRPLSARDAAAVEQHVLLRAGGQTPGLLRAALRRTVLRLDPHGAEARRLVRLTERRVVLHPGEDGTADLVGACLGAVDATAIYQRLDDLARAAAPGDTRSMDQRRADTFVDLLLGRAVHLVTPVGRRVDPESGRAAGRVAGGRTACGATDTAAGGAGGRAVCGATDRAAGDAGGTAAGDRLVGRVTDRVGGRAIGRAVDGTGGRAGRHRGRVRVHVTVAATTLLGLDELPGELAGYGPVPAEVARELAADGTWRRLLTDPATGAVVDVGRRSYRPAAALAEYVRVRDRTCRFPGCRQPARRCDLDHNDAYPDGATEPGNLCCLCRHHHRLKHRGRWSMLHEPDDSIVWTSPVGRTYVTTPEPATVVERYGGPEDRAAGGTAANGC